MDFYENLSAVENEAMRRARAIRAAEQHTAQRFHGEAPPPAPPQPPEAQAPPKPPLASLFSGSLFSGNRGQSPDWSLMMLLFFILQGEQSDPLLTLALVYIMM